MKDPDSVEYLKQIRELYEKAIALPESERAAFLDKACGGDEDLHKEINVLLKRTESDDSPFDDLLNEMIWPALETLGNDPSKLLDWLVKNEISPEIMHSAAEAKFEDPEEKLGTHIGPYHIVELIGEGGFGIVYRVEQTEPIHRELALKIIKPGMDSRDIIARFERERQALALLDHPNIAQIHDAGTTEDGHPYFVMELATGKSITQYCDIHRLSIKERLLLFQQVCSAIQHAHQKGILHRDLKPTNIVVIEQDGMPMPKIIDFGVAKSLLGPLSDNPLITQQEVLIGTPVYMSPEQMQLSSDDLDTRTDIYSLGVVLYELIAGVQPFSRKTLLEAALEEVRRIIREVEPPKPSTRVHTLGAELTALAKSRSTEPPT